MAVSNTMVITCPQTFPEAEEAKYAEAFGCFPHLTLSPFQKWAVKAIEDGDHSLVTAHTGSGKTLPAEFAILRAARRGKRVVYTAPIKALSNTKLADLRSKYPDISFGLITGDITDNPDAQVLIMTTEVLPNAICGARARRDAAEGAALAPLSFEMDYDNELDVVVFDEVHYINDDDRGRAWEEAMLLLPPSVQLVMLSATIAQPEAFASWVERSKADMARSAGLIPKKLYLSSSPHRVVPLRHHLWLSASSKAITHPRTKDAVAGMIGKELVLQGPGKPFDEHLYNRAVRAVKAVEDNRMTLRRAGALNGLLTHLAKTEQLPAIAFVFSRRQTEVCAREVHCDLGGSDDRLDVETQCRHILSSRLKNYKEYLELPEYLQLLTMLRKGVAVHHAGILPVFREMIEMLFAKRVIRVLFATETLAVGVNFSTASVIFTALEKYDGCSHRTLLPHEYTQMAGRAGRRGIDTKGQVWICAEMCGVAQMRPSTCRRVMSGAPPLLRSKFRVGLGMVLRLHDAGKEAEEGVFASTLFGSDLALEAQARREEVGRLEKEAERQQEGLKWLATPTSVLSEYKELVAELKGARKRKRGRLAREAEALKEMHASLHADAQLVEKADAAVEEAALAAQKVDAPLGVLPSMIAATRELLARQGFMEGTEASLSEKGMLALQIREAHPLALAETIAEHGWCAEVGAAQLAALISCQAGIPLPRGEGPTEAMRPCSGDSTVDALASTFSAKLHEYDRLEREYGLDSGEAYEINFSGMKAVMQWCNADSETACKAAIAQISIDTGAGIGAFTKALLKICNIAAEIQKGGDATGRLGLAETASKVPELLLKYVATAQSLYI